MNQPLEQHLRRYQREKRQRRLTRQAFASVYAKLVHLVPVVLPCAGRLVAFPMTESYDDVLGRLAPVCVFAFETALEIRSGRRVLTCRDLHAYTADMNACGMGKPLTSIPSLLPVHQRPPCVYLVEVTTLPAAVSVGGRRSVTAERLLREYLGTLGHRFDLLAVVLHALGDEFQASV